MSPEDRDELRDVRHLRIAQLFGLVDGFGHLHIIVEDGNVGDDHLDFCELELHRSTSATQALALEWELIAQLRAVSEGVREVLWQVAGGRLKP